MNLEKLINSEGIIRRCCLCKRYRTTGVGGEWTELGYTPNGKISDTYCPSCYLGVMKQTTERRKGE